MLAVVVHRDGDALKSAGSGAVNPDDWHADALRDTAFKSGYVVRRAGITSVGFYDDRQPAAGLRRGRRRRAALVRSAFAAFVVPMPSLPTSRFAAPGHPPATITEFRGVRFLHLGTSWVQGAMRIDKPDAIELEYVQMMMLWLLFNAAPKHIVQLGLGSAALTKFCYHRFPDARVTAAELNPNVIAICRDQFALPPNDARLDVREMNAMDFVTDPANHGRVDILQVDLYDEEARGPVLDSPAFYQACYDCLSDDGIMTTNVFGDYANYDVNLDNMRAVFDAVVWLPEVHDANIVVLAFKRAPEIDFSILYERAGEIKRSLNLPARSWVNGLKEWMRDQQEE